jgi:hypothetical protein
MAHRAVLAAAIGGLARAAAANTALGCNAQPPGGRNLVFADLVKTSMFLDANATGPQNITVDARGWPAQDFALYWFAEEYIWPAADMSGTYTITALGCATVSALFSGATVVNQSCAGGSLLAFMEVSANGTLVNGHAALAFTSTTRGAGLGAGLTNLSLLLPGYPAGTDPDTLHEPFLANMRGRCSVTRFLGWAFYGHTNYSSHDTQPTPPDWARRPRLGDPTYFLGGWGTVGMGVPFEIIARIANALQTDVWLNVPSSPNETLRDEYVVALLTLMDGALPVGRKIYLEYANECFFGNNQCYQDDVAIANATVHAGDPYKLNFGLPSPPNASNFAVWGSRMCVGARAQHVRPVLAGPDPRAHLSPSHPRTTHSPSSSQVRLHLLPLCVARARRRGRRARRPRRLDRRARCPGRWRAAVVRARRREQARVAQRRVGPAHSGRTRDNEHRRLLGCG